MLLSTIKHMLAKETYLALQYTTTRPFEYLYLRGMIPMNEAKMAKRDHTLIYLYISSDKSVKCNRRRLPSIIYFFTDFNVLLQVNLAFGSTHCSNETSSVDESIWVCWLPSKID